MKKGEIKVPPRECPTRVRKSTISPRVRDDIRDAMEAIQERDTLSQVDLVEEALLDLLEKRCGKKS